VALIICASQLGLNNENVSDSAPLLLWRNTYWHRAIALTHPTAQDNFMSIFDEQYRVVCVEGDRLTVKGIHTGDVLTIIPPEPQEPLSRDEYPIGKLIALSDPSERLIN
jgi:hypothetical protein